jgi:glyoxylase-like metal-dependent hydrolase (beta-lactamase superfamily II)
MHSHPLVRVHSIREGETDGSGTILRIEPVVGQAFHAVAVPQDWYSYTGPTWIYVVETENGLTLIDAGSGLVVERISQAFDLIEKVPTDIERVVISHGHLDHDGGALLLAREWGIEVWAHVLWGSLRFHERSGSEGSGWDAVRKALDDDLASDAPLAHRPASDERRRRQERYNALRREVNVSRLVDHGDTADGLTFYHTPGHAPDELTIERGAVLFAGDHILPEITPHPTIKTRLPAGISDTLPTRHRDEKKLYGLDVYLRSLQMIGNMPEETLVMPAHRLVNRGRMHILTVSRARDISEHHLERLEFILDAMGTESWALGDLTKALFRHRSLQNVYEAALHETMAHVELLLSTGDIVETPEQRFAATGSQHYLAVLTKV